ncbi:hypothetical protein ACOCJ7_18185 [Knoellia sp. CPCC 206453]|uniref:hypothetical protein n=1 Tax=Knoellia pratensis TaxID=3404796 RepID=UPI003B431823
MEVEEVQVVVREHLDGPWSRVPSATRVATSESVMWYGAGHQAGVKGRVLQLVANPIRRMLTRRYDVYIQTMAGANLASAVRAPVRLVIPSGNVVPAAMRAHFTAIAMQAPDNTRFVPPGMKSTLLPPPVFDLAPRAEAPSQDIPDEFLLTVFNPYDPIKGLSDLARAADEAPLPIVWCHSEATVRFEIPEELLLHDRIVHVTDASPEQLRYLYERCAAYFSLSLSEGFGWSTADALRYSQAVVTRAVGVFSNPAAQQPGVTLVSSPQEICWDSVLASAAPPGTRDLSLLEPSRFRARLHDIAHDADW